MNKKTRFFMLEILFVLLLIGVVSLYFSRKTLTLDTLPHNLSVYFDDTFLGTTPITLESGMIKGEKYAAAFEKLCKRDFSVTKHGIVINDSKIRVKYDDGSPYENFYKEGKTFYFVPKAYMEVMEKNSFEKLVLIFKDDPAKNLDKKYLKEKINLVEAKK